VDLKSWSSLIHDGFACKLTIDFTSLFGDVPEKFSSADLAKRWEAQLGGLMEVSLSLRK